MVNTDEEDVMNYTQAWGGRAGGEAVRLSVVDVRPLSLIHVVADRSSTEKLAISSDWRSSMSTNVSHCAERISTRKVLFSSPSLSLTSLFFFLFSRAHSSFGSVLGSNTRSFDSVFARAQTLLRETFGMEVVKLPPRNPHDEPPVVEDDLQEARNATGVRKRGKTFTPPQAMMMAPASLQPVTP